MELKSQNVHLFAIFQAAILLNLPIIIQAHIHHEGYREIPTTEELLTNEELREIFPHYKSVPVYNLFEPTFQYSTKVKRRIKRFYNYEEPTRLRFQAIGKNYNFRLTKNTDLLSNSFAFIGRDLNKSTILEVNQNKEDFGIFIGIDEATTSNHPAKIAISLGTQMLGVVTGEEGGEDLVIQPFPTSILSSRRKRRSTLHISSHLIYKRNQIDQCSVKDEGDDTAEVERTSYLLERGSLHRRYSPEASNRDRFSQSGSTASINSFNDKYNTRQTEDLYIETAVFVDKDLYRHMKTNFPENTKHQVLQFVLAMVNAVQLLYNDETLGHRIKFVIKRLEILYDDPVGLHRTFDIDEFLTNFCKWQRWENPTMDSDSLHWDHALILTGLDLFTVNQGGKVNPQVVGLAPVTGMCTHSSSCTVNEGRHFESVYVVTHEIGHNLGMRHDGLQAGNNCDPGRYLMSPTLGSGKISWSHCSRIYLDTFLDSRQAECLRDLAIPINQALNHEWGDLPGQRFSADMQCTLKHGVGSYHASETQSLTDVCEDLHCRRDHYSWTSHPALEGTTCGNARWCRRGSCVLNKASPQNSHNYYITHPANPLPTEGEWGMWEKCRSFCLYGSNGILSSGSTGISISERQCRSCRGQYRYRACSAVHECSEMKRKTLQDFANKICSTLAYDTYRFTGQADKIPLSGLNGCEVKCLDSHGRSMTSRKSFPDGSVCSSPTKYPAYCISGLCTEFRCEKESLYGADPATCRPDAGLPNPHKPLNSFRPTTSSTISPNLHSVSASASTNNKNSFDSSSSSFNNPVTKWSPWEPTSNCRFSCMDQARGIQLVNRECLLKPCNGLDRNIQLCTPDQNECDKIESSFEYATAVCQKYQIDVSELSGVGMQLASTLDDPDRPCTVACQDGSIHYRFYRVNGRGGWFPFGTDCSKDISDRKSYCLNGKCLEFHEDGTPLRNSSTTQQDERLSRSLPLNRDVIDASHLTILPDDILKYPDKSGSDNRRESTSNLYQRNRMPFYGYVEHPWKRDVLRTSHRVEGSFSDTFLLRLIDELNATLALNRSLWKNRSSNSTIDLDDPLYASNPSMEFYSPSSDQDSRVIEGIWKVIYTPCSVTCGDGVLEIVVMCEARSSDNYRNAKMLKTSAQIDQSPNHVYCNGRPPVQKGFKECSPGKICLNEHFDGQNSSNNGYGDTTPKPLSRVGRWLMDHITKALSKNG